MKLAVGFFDGVHLGHQRILSRADAALTFVEHPLSVVAPEKAPALLMTAEERVESIASALGGSKGLNGVKAVKALPFTRELAAEPPETFADQLHEYYPDLEKVLCGPNWHFGAGGAGDADFLRGCGFEVEVVPFENNGGKPVSSTRIRAALASGDIPVANEMLGRRFAVCGTVAAGKGEGRVIGFPTINVRPANPDLPRLLPFGAYVVETGFGAGVANWGQAPTMGDRAWPSPVFEVHIIRPLTALRPLKPLEPLEPIEPLEPLEPLESLKPFEPLRALKPKSRFKFTLVRFLRPERRFASIDELREQIAADVFSASHSITNIL